MRKTLDLNLRHLRYVVELGRTRNFTRAAERLGVAQPALSHAIATMERELSVTLFERTSRRVRPTAAGTLFIEGAEQVLKHAEQLRAATQEHTGLVRGVLKIGTIIYFGDGQMLPSVVGEFQAAYPGIEVSLDDDNMARLLDSVRTGRFDVAFANVADPKSNPDLALTAVAWDEAAVALPEGHPLASRPHLTLDDLRDEPFIAYKPGSNLQELFSAAARAVGFTPKTVARSGSTHIVRALVSAGVGVSLGCRSYLLSPGPPIAIVPLSPQIGWHTMMVTRAGSESSPAAAAFLTFIKERLPLSHG